MKILHVITHMDPKMGGVCQAVRTMIFGLTGLGNHNEVVSLDAPESPFLREDPFTVHALGPAKGPWAYAPTLTGWLLQNFNRFDIVIVHGLWQFHGYAVEQAFKKYGTQLKNEPFKRSLPKLFLMPHGMLDPYFQQAEGRKLKAIRNLIYWKLIERKVVNNADALLFTCEEERLLARKPFRPYHPKREFVVGLGVEEPPAYDEKMREAFSEKCPELNHKPYLLFLSRIHEKKGVDLLIKSYIEIFKNSDKSESEFPKLVIAGPGLDSSYGEAMQKLVLDAGELRDSIFFPGMLVKEAKWGAFYGCQAFVLPSHQENFGIAIVEALACAKPVLISKQVNIWREIELAGGGIVADDTLQGTVQLLKRWVDLSHEAKQSMGIKARSGFEKNFAIAPAALRIVEASKA